MDTLGELWSPTPSPTNSTNSTNSTTRNPTAAPTHLPTEHLQNMTDYGTRGLAVYAEGGLTQVILVGADASSQMTQGQFKLRYVLLHQ